MHIKPRATIYHSNIGATDRVVRVAASIAMVGSFMALQAPGTAVYALLALLSVPVATTALLRWDPIYAVLGLNTTGERVHPAFANANLGRTDQVIRYGLSAALVGGFMIAAPTPVGLSAVLPLLAIGVFGTAVTSWCPLYTMLNLSTRPVKRTGTVVNFNGEPRKAEPDHGRRAA